MFDEGFSFDEASGTMSFENGTSYTDDMLLSSTVAEISHRWQYRPGCKNI